MAYTNIDDPSAYFHTLLWTGNGADDRALTNDANAGNFKPDWVWVKARSAAEWHNVYDSSRGANKGIYPNDTYLEESLSQTFESFDTNGFTVSYNSAYSSVFTNKNSTTYVAWQWKANGGTTSSNSDGNITSTVQANTTAGFSIVTWTGNGSDNQTIGHGLGVKPTWWVVKRRDSAGSWVVGSSLGFWGGTSNYMLLNGTQANSDNVNNIWGDSPPNTTTIRVKNDAELNANNGTYVAYVFANKQGFSKCGSYEGNSNANGPFIYTGFKPAFVMLKPADVAEQWVMHDGARDPGNKAYHYLFANGSEAEASGGTHGIDLLSNGFKIRTNNANWNASSTVTYMAFAENPFVTSTGIPTTAR